MLLRHIRYFLAVAEHRNFTRAATSLHVSQPALSQQIRQLEALLGAQLFDRSGKSVRMTDAGEAWTVLPAQISTTHQELRAIPLQQQMAPRQVGYMRRKGAYRSPASNALTDVLHDLMQDLTLGA